MSLEQGRTCFIVTREGGVTRARRQQAVGRGEAAQKQSE